MKLSDQYGVTKAVELGPDVRALTVEQLKSELEARTGKMVTFRDRAKFKAGQPERQRRYRERKGK